MKDAGGLIFSVPVLHLDSRLWHLGWRKYYIGPSNDGGRIGKKAAALEAAAAVITTRCVVYSGDPAVM